MRIGSIVRIELVLDEAFALIYSVASGSTCNVSSDDAFSNQKHFQSFMLWLKCAIKILYVIG